MKNLQNALFFFFFPDNPAIRQPMKILLFIFSLYSFTAGAFFWSEPDWMSDARLLVYEEPFRIYSKDKKKPADDFCELTSGSDVVVSWGDLIVDADYHEGCSMVFKGFVSKIEGGRLCVPEEIEISLPKWIFRLEYTRRPRDVLHPGKKTLICHGINQILYKPP